MKCFQDIDEAIAKYGFTEFTLHAIDELVNQIENGSTDLPRFNLREHSGVCKAGPALIGASIVARYAERSLTAGGHAGSGQGSPSNWEIDELQEKLIERWARAARLWVEASDDIVRKGFGPMIAEGAEAKVYYRDGSPAVLKERASIYSTTQKALDAIALHNYIFPETAMRVIGFTRDSDKLFRVILTQPYVRCQRLATKEEIDKLVAEKGFRDNWEGQGVNYISDRIALEDMHPANVFIDEVTSLPICIDCIVKFVKKEF